MICHVTFLVSKSFESQAYENCTYASTGDTLYLQEKIQLKTFKAKSEADQCCVPQLFTLKIGHEEMQNLRADRLFAELPAALIPWPGQSGDSCIR